MNKIMVTCPATGKHVSTGIITNKDTFDHLPNTISSMNCPHCGTAHAWHANEAWLESERPTPLNPAGGLVYVNES
jgi:endogenous inhibitor of DNA gyrase (YacG/DUF329 family)